MFLWHPFANKLKRKSNEEVRQKMMMVEGILSVLEGEAPRVIEQKLSSYLSVEERRKLAAKKTGREGGGPVCRGDVKRQRIQDMLMNHGYYHTPI